MMKYSDEQDSLLPAASRNEFLNMHLQRRLQSVGEYTTQRRLSYRDCGKNKGVRIVLSRSRLDYSKTKLWVFKPLYSTFLSEDYCIETLFRRLLTTMLTPFSSYELQGASREVFCGRLAATIFGKDRAPDTRFNLRQRGIVSRVIGGDATRCLDMYQFASLFPENNRFSNLSADAHTSLLDAILYALITGNRDIQPRNMIVRFKLADNDLPIAFMIYGIDHEYAFRNGCLMNLVRSIRKVTLKDLLSDFYLRPDKIFGDLLFPSFCSDQIIDKQHVKSRLALNTYFVTTELYVRSLRGIVDKLHANNFKACYETKDHIYKKLQSPGTVYTTSEIEDVIEPTFDDAILVVKENVRIVEEFLLSLENDAKVESNLYKGYKLS